MKIFLMSNQVFPFVLMFFVIGFSFVLFRMKGVDLDYKIAGLRKDIEYTTQESKELKAKKARLLSVKRLRKLASKYGLAQPKQKQIIVIKDK
jgi:hypothetical protein